MDDGKVQTHIDRSFAQQMDIYTGAGRLEQAWAWLYQTRQTDDPNDDDAELAAAEHYMWARWQVGAGKIDPLIMYLLVLGYDPAKLLGYVPVVYLARRAMKHTWTRPSFGSIAWGNAGVAEGRRDKAVFAANPAARVR